MLRVLLCLLLLTTSQVLASQEWVGRYTVTETLASPEQRFPLIQMKTVVIPRSVQTNLQAIEFVLQQTGYQLASERVRTREDLLLMEKPLADVSRSYTNITVLEMLNSLAGLGFAPVVDPINRLVAFEAIYDFIER